MLHHASSGGDVVRWVVMVAAVLLCACQPTAAPQARTDGSGAAATATPASSPSPSPSPSTDPLWASVDCPAADTHAAGEVVSLDADWTDGVKEVAVAYGDGEVARNDGVRTDDLLSHRYATRGRYHVTLTVSDAAGQRAMDSCVLELVDGEPDPPTATVSCPAPFTVGATQTAVVTVGSSWQAGDATVDRFTVDFGDGTTDSSPAPTDLERLLSHEYSHPGTYQVTFTVTDADGLTASATCGVTWTREAPAPPPAPPPDSGGWVGCYYDGLFMGGSVHVVDYAHLADVSVQVVDQGYRADLGVVVVDYAHQANDCGEWYFVDYAHQADFAVFFVDHAYRADFAIVETRSWNAGR